MSGMCRKYKIKFGGSTCSSQVISLTKQKQNLNNFKIKVYYSAGILYQGTHNVVVVVVFAFGVRSNGNVFARQRGASQVLVGKGTVQQRSVVLLLLAANSLVNWSIAFFL